MRATVAAVVAVLVLAGGIDLKAATTDGQDAAPPAATRQVDPIRCWWQSSAGAITTGEVFSLALTCAALDTEAVQVVPDESRLGVASVQLAPFEILGGDHPPDSHVGSRRFFQ